MASLYFDEALARDAVAVGARLTLGGDEARHAAAVARVRVGERIAVGDGAGFVATGVVVAADPKRVEVEVQETRVDPEPVPPLALVQALAKGGRDELAVQMATELGVAVVVPWQAERSISRWDAGKAAKGRERWQQIVREASKQAIRSRIPAVESLVSGDDLAASAGTAQLLVLDPTADTRLGGVDLADDRAIHLVVGPEGGISQRELAALQDAGAQRVRLGTEVLRTSTAGAAALAVLNARLGRW